MNHKLIKLLLVPLLLVIALPNAAWALDVQTTDNMPVRGDVVLGPGKIDLVVSPGEKVERKLEVVNRTGKPVNFTVDIEDFTGSNDSPTQLLGNEKGPYSLKDFLKPEAKSFKLAHGERANLNVDIDIPKDAEPGGLYGAVIIRSDNVKEGEDGSNEAVKGQISVVQRLATLFFIRVKGEVKEEGILSSFIADKSFYQQGNVNFKARYENKGKVHLNPWGVIEISNFLGKKLDTIDVAPFFVMPGFSRTRDISWSRPLSFGYYTATLKMNRGYGDLSDTATVGFWIVPLKVLGIALLAIVILALFIRWFASKFELKRK